MAVDLPPLQYGYVKARFVAGIGESAGSPSVPDGIPLTGTVTFNLSADVVRITTAQPVPTTFYPRPITAAVDTDGYLTWGGARLLPLPATDDPAMNPTNLQWTVSFDLRTPDGYKVMTAPWRFVLPVGQTVDLTDVAPLTTPAPNTVIVKGDKGDPADLPERLQPAPLAATMSDVFAAEEVDGGQGLIAKLDMRIQGTSSLALVSDSTGNEALEWFYRSLQMLGARYPQVQINHRLWNDSTQAYDGYTSVQVGSIPGDPVWDLQVEDYFNRVSPSELLGSLPSRPDSASRTWGGSSDSAGDFVVNGAGAVIQSATPYGRPLLYAPQVGAAARIRFTYSPTASNTGARAFSLLMKNSGTGAALSGRFDIAAGAESLTVTLRNGTNTVLATSAAIAITPGADITGSLEYANGSMTMYINGALAATTVLSASDRTAYGSNRYYGMQVPGTSAAGDVVKYFGLDISTTGSDGGQVLNVTNGAKAGAKLTYQLDRLATMYPASLPIDLVIINHGHNYTGTTPATFTQNVDDFMKAFRALHPESGIMVTSQNPEFFIGSFADASWPPKHASRNVALRKLAARRGWGYIPGYEAFVNYPGGALRLVDPADGVHPTKGTGSGSEVWAQAAYASYVRLSRI